MESCLAYFFPSGIYYTFPLFKREDGTVVACQLDLVQCVAALGAGPLSPLTILIEGFIGKIIGAPAPVSFQSNPKALKKEEITAEKNKLEAIKGQAEAALA